MKNYIGRKCKGFRFESGTDRVDWFKAKKECIGKIGIITDQYRYHVTVDFNIGFNLFYPISLIEKHLIDVDTSLQNVDTSPEIPQLGEGIEMEVSNDDITWYNRNVIAQMQDGWYIINGGSVRKYARPIQEVKKYTKEELVKILGHDFEMV